MSERLRFPSLLAAFFLSGLAGLVYQTAWSQELALVFGTSELAVAAVLAAYMAGLALGAGLAGRWQHRVRRPVLVYALLELGIGLSALCVPLALAAARKLQVMLLGGLEVLPESAGLTSAGFYLSAAFLILMVPTGLMGATLPLLTRHAVRRDREIGPRVALLYTANTVGAAAGTLLAAFLLLPALGLGRTVLVGVAANGLVFLLALGLARGDSAPPPEPAPRRDRGWSWILPLILVSGAVSLASEVLWTRVLTFLLGGSVYAFGTMLATFLVGIALGSAAAARMAASRERARLGFVWVQMLIAALSLAAFAALDRLPALVAGLGGGASLGGSVALCAATLLPAALAIGATFPFAVRILARDAGEAGAASARVYAWNTTGAILGAVGAGFLLLPALRLAGMITALAATSLALALASALVLRPRLKVAAGVAVAGLVLVLAWPPATPWNVLRHSVLQGARAPHVAAAKAEKAEAPFYAVGRGATVMLTEHGGEWRLTTNGLPESVIQPAGARPRRYALARWLSLLPIALRPETRSMLVIGLGAGNTVEYVPESVETLHVVELEAEVVRANRFLAPRRGRDPLADPRLELHVDDARGALMLSDQRFDAIVSQPSHPWTAGASHLFTREFFALTRDHLTPRGVFLQWIGLAFVDHALVRTLVATLGDVFPYVEVYRPASGALLFVAANEPFAPRATAGRAVAAAPDAWRRVGVNDGEDVVMARVLDNAGARAFAAGAALNTDRHNLLQARSPRLLGNPPDRDHLEQLLEPHDPLLLQPPSHPLYTVRQLIRLKQTARARRLAQSLPPTERQIGLAIIAMTSGRGQAATRPLWRILEQDPNQPEALAALLFFYRQAIVQGSAPRLTELAARDPAAAAVVEGWRRAHGGNRQEVRDLEPTLAAIPPRHPLHTAAVRLRVGWRQHAARQADGAPQLAAEAIELLDPLLPNTPPAADLLLRARLAILADDAPIALASLFELASHPTAKPLLGQAKQVFDALPAAARQDPRHRSLGALLP